MANSKSTDRAKEFIDNALAERGRLGYSAKVSKASYGRAVNQAAGVFAKLERCTERSSRRS